MKKESYKTEASFYQNENGGVYITVENTTVLLQGEAVYIIAHSLPTFDEKKYLEFYSRFN